MNLVWIHFRTTSLSQHHWIHCTVARELWDLVLGLFGVKWVFPNTVKEVLYSWGGAFVGKKGKNSGIPFRYSFFGWFGRKRID